MAFVHGSCQFCGRDVIRTNNRRTGFTCGPCDTERGRNHSRAWTRAIPTNRRLVYSARSRSKRAGIEFTITPEDITIPEFCPVLGIPIRQGNGRQDPNMASLDRFDNSRGYVPGNVRVISWRANQIKGNATPEELSAVARYAAGKPATHD